QRAAAELLGQRIEHIRAAPGEQQLRPPVAEGSGDRVAQPARRAREQHGPSRDVHGGKIATVAVNPCRKLSPPTGPISPAAKNPAAGAPASSRCSAPASWSGAPNMSRPRPLQVNTTAPAGPPPPTPDMPRPRAP